MNTKNNKRRRESVEKIQKAFINMLQSKEISQISVTDICKETELKVVSRYLQVKTSEGTEIQGDKNHRDFSFHPKIRYDMGDDVFYVWIAVFNDDRGEKKCYYYIFNTKDVSKFDNIEIDTYQVTDNQKTTLRIRNTDGAVVNKGKKYSYSCFNDKFFLDFDCLEIELK